MNLISTKSNQKLARAIGAIVLLIIFLLNSFFTTSIVPKSGKVSLRGNHKKYGEFSHQLRKWRILNYEFEEDKFENLSLDMIIHVEKNQIEIDSDEKLIVQVTNVQKLKGGKYKAEATVKVGEDNWPANFEFITSQNLDEYSIEGVLSFKNNPKIFSIIRKPIFEIEARINSKM